MARRPTASGPFLGLISDTHGLVRPEAVRVLAGCERIVHAGDVGKHEVLVDLERTAPVEGVRGNVDYGPWADALPDEHVFEWRGRRILVVHDRSRLRRGDLAAAPDAVVFGHSHRPSIERRDGILFVNPGSAGPRRFRLPIAVGRLELAGGSLEASIHELEPAPRKG